MATFAKLAEWPVGYFRSHSGWLLRHRRTVASRVSTLNAEIERIGFVNVQYRSVTSDDGETKTEEVTGISVTSGSNLERLLQAYIANGGDPLSVSPFMHPQSTELEVDDDGEATKVEKYPNSGVVFPISSDPNDPVSSDKDTGYGMSEAGTLSTYQYSPSRQGGRVSPGAYDQPAIVKTMHHLRSWANQDIREVLHDLESRIIKQCDLQEQLIKERDETLVQVFGGFLNGVADIDPERFDTNMLFQNLYQDMANTVFEKNADGVTLIPTSRKDTFSLWTYPNVPPEVAKSL